METARKSYVMLAAAGLVALTACAATDAGGGGLADGSSPDGGPVGAVETCNGVDDDGDGLVDESPTGTGLLTEPCATLCGPGQRLCMGGTMGDCSAPVPDAMGECPCVEGEVRPCSTECGSGLETCLGGDFTGCTAPLAQEEACDDGVDNDCDGAVDEGCGACVPGEKKRCGTDTGACESGTRTCRTDGTWGSCVGNVGPGEEVCDGLDNDCDGETDEGLPSDDGESDDTCPQARRIPDVMEDVGPVTESGTINPSGDEDWMWIRAVEGWHDCEPFAGQCYYDLTAQLSPPPGADLQLCLYPDWPADSPPCGVVGDPASSYCTEPGELSLVLSWEGICMLDDTIDFAVVVREWLGSAPSCEPYHLTFSLAGPQEICPGEDW